MIEIKGFDEFIKKGIVRKVTPDPNRANNLKARAEDKKDSLKERIDKIGISDKNAEDYVESCYDIIMLMIRAKMLLSGYNATGYEAHKAEVSYLKNLGFSENEVQFMDKLRYFRNGILYYGTVLDKDYAEKVIDFFNQAYPKLKKLIKK